MATQLISSNVLQRGAQVGGGGAAGARLIQHGLQLQALPRLRDALQEGQQVVVQMPPVACVACGAIGSQLRSACQIGASLTRIVSAGRFLRAVSRWGSGLNKLKFGESLS